MSCGRSLARATKDFGWWGTSRSRIRSPVRARIAGFQFNPSGELVYKLTDWLSPAVEYYGDMGSIQPLAKVQEQQHFIVPTLNFYLIPQLELNLGVGIGVTRASNGVFLKSIVGWTF